MLLTAFLIAGLLVLAAAVPIVVLVLCGRLFRAEKATLGRATAVCGILLASPGLGLLLWFHRPSSAAFVGLGILALVQFPAMWLLIRWLFRTGSGKAALIMLAWLIASPVLSFALAWEWRAAVAESFVVPTGAMAPTIYGQHICETPGRSAGGGY